MREEEGSEDGKENREQDDKFQRVMDQIRQEQERPTITDRIIDFIQSLQGREDQTYFQLFESCADKVLTEFLERHGPLNDDELLQIGLTNIIERIGNLTFRDIELANKFGVLDEIFVMFIEKLESLTDQEAINEVDEILAPHADIIAGIITYEQKFHYYLPFLFERCPKLMSTEIMQESIAAAIPNIEESYAKGSESLVGNTLLDILFSDGLLSSQRVREEILNLVRIGFNWKTLFESGLYHTFYLEELDWYIETGSTGLGSVTIPSKNEIMDSVSKWGWPWTRAALFEEFCHI